MSEAASSVVTAEPRTALLSRALFVVMAIVSLAGIGVAAYLTFVHYAGLPVYCTGSGGCHTVQSSEYAELLSMPVALLGLVLYCSIFGAVAVAFWGRGRAGAFAPYAVFGLALSGTMYSAYLTWLEVYRIQAICTWCVTSASLLATVLVLSAVELAVSGRWRDALELEGDEAEESET